MLPGSVLSATPFFSLDHYGARDGLSQSTVTALAEDDRGFLWLGTQEGLNRFDGHRFVVYRDDDPQRPLISSSVDALAVDARARLWVGSNDSGVEVIELDGGRRHRIDERIGLSHVAIRHLLPDADGSAWIGTVGGVDRVDAALSSSHRLGATAPVVGLQRADDGRVYALDSECRLYRVGTATLQPLPRAMPAGTRCFAMQATADGLWVASSFGALWLLDGEGALQRQVEMAADAAERTALGRVDDALLIGHADGTIAQLDRGSDRLRPVLLDRPLGGGVRQFHQLRDGGLWIGSTASGLYRVRALSRAIRRDIVSDADLARWPSRSVHSIWTDGAQLLVGTDAGLAWRRGDRDWQTVAAIGATSIRRILPHPDGGWWIGSHRGLWRLHADGRATPIDAQLSDPRVADLLFDGTDLWVATRGGLARLRDDRRLAEPVPAALQSEFLTSLMRDAQGRLWIGSNERGAFVLHGDGTLESLATANGRLQNDSVWSIHGDAGAIWFGTYSGGLQRLDAVTGELTVHDRRHGLPNNVVYRSLPDAAGRLWLSTNNGIGVLDRDSGVIRTLGTGDGLRNGEFNSGAGFVDAEGLMYFGGIDGVDVIDPGLMTGLEAPATPVITAARLLGGHSGLAHDIDVVYASRLELDYREAIVALDLVAIDFTAPDAAQLRYRIDGVHRDWVQPGRAHAELVLSHLPMGEHRLDVEAAGRDGRFDRRTTLTLSVPAPPWRHPLAWLGYGVAATALVLWMGWRLRRQVRRKREQIELLNRTVDERTAELARANRLLQQSNQQLDLATRTDPLTQLSNRRELAEWMQREAALLFGSEQERTLLFFMIDLDDFKRINDRFGHQVGDAVLVATGTRLRRLCREHDIVVRWGGEEFLMLVRAHSANEAPVLAERIRAALAATPVKLEDNPALSVTCSVGFAPWPFAPHWRTLGDWEQSIALADRALYAAKAAGKNAWVGLCPGRAIERDCLQRLLAGAAPSALTDGCIEVRHSHGIAPDVR